MARPTTEQIAEARDRFDYLAFDKASVRELEQKLDSILGKDATKHIRVLLAATEPPTAKELAELLAKHWHGEFCETFDVEYAQSRMNHGDRFDVAENVKFVMAHFLGPVKP